LQALTTAAAAPDSKASSQKRRASGLDEEADAEADGSFLMMKPLVECNFCSVAAGQQAARIVRQPVLARTRGILPKIAANQPITVVSTHHLCIQILLPVFPTYP
jgi:hypothetical protein